MKSTVSLLKNKQTVPEPAVRPTNSEATRMRGTIIVNPYSSGLTAKRERIIVTTLREHLDLEVRRTERPHHATELVRNAIDDGVDLVIACGGDGTANEVVNGMDLADNTADSRPQFAMIPAGGTNVLARSLGMPNNPIKGAQHLAKLIQEGRSTPINLGKIDERIFLFAAGIGLDGEIVKQIENKRSGRRPSDAAHIAVILKLFAKERLRMRDRMTIRIDETGEELRSAMLMCANTAPLTYVGKIRLDLVPYASLENDLDFIAPHTLNAIRAAFAGSNAVGLRKSRLATKEDIQMRSNVRSFTVICDDPEPCQVDGEYIGERTHIRLSSVQNCLNFVY